jgi:hypothetical protein
MEGLEDHASEPQDMDDALSLPCAYDHEFVERLSLKFLGDHCQRRSSRMQTVWMFGDVVGHRRASARAIPFWIPDPWGNLHMATRRVSQQ